MSQYSNILLCTDFSKSSEVAAAKANELAETLGADLTVLHVVTYVPPSYVGIELPKKYATVEYIVERAEHHLKIWCDEQKLISCTQTINAGNAKKAISKYAESSHVDLIVVGDQGESAIMQPFGSVASYVVQHSHCDVLVVRS
jgi:nucleotide-binding universal stress UspA family protein